MQLRARILLGALLAMSLCLFARAANAASAPFCDDRAATSLASPPTLQPPETLLRVALVHRLSCDDEYGGAATAPAIAPGHGPPHLSSRGADSVLPACAALTTAPTAGPIALTTHAAPPREGVHCRIERPPRG